MKKTKVLPKAALPNWYTKQINALAATLTAMIIPISKGVSIGLLLDQTREGGEISNMLCVEVPTAEDVNKLCTGERNVLPATIEDIQFQLTFHKEAPQDFVVPSLILRLFSGRHMKIEQLIQQLYGLQTEETGHVIKGHSCINRDDRNLALMAQGSLLYGEVLQSGVTKALGRDRLRGSEGEVLYDLGMGIGKFAVQAFLEYPNLRKVVGVELSKARATIAKQTLHRLCSIINETSSSCEWEAKVEDFEQKPAENSFGLFNQAITRLTLNNRAIGCDRILEFRHQNLFDANDAKEADIVICQTHFPVNIHLKLLEFLAGLEPRSRLLTYESLDTISEKNECSHPFTRLKPNMKDDDRYWTSWAVNRGHRFHLWEREEELEQGEAS